MLSNISSITMYRRPMRTDCINLQLMQAAGWPQCVEMPSKLLGTWRSGGLRHSTITTSSMVQGRNTKMQTHCPQPPFTSCCGSWSDSADQWSPKWWLYMVSRLDNGRFAVNAGSRSRSETDPVLDAVPHTPPSWLSSRYKVSVNPREAVGAVELTEVVEWCYIIDTEDGCSTWL